MSIPYTKGTAFSSPTTLQAWIEYPFRKEGDSATKVYHHIMQVLAEDYTTLADDVVLTDAGAKPARSPFPDDSAAYYAGDYNLAHIGDGLVQFDRQFAHIPADRTVSNGMYAFSLFTGTKAYNFEKTGSPSFSISGGLGTWKCSFSLSGTAKNNFNVGDYFFIDYGSSSGTHFLTTDLTGDTFDNERFLEWKITSKSGGATANYTADLRYPDGFTALAKGTSTSWKFNIYWQAARSTSEVINRPSFLSYRYVKSSDPASIVLQERFLVKNDEGESVTLIEGTRTSPSQSAYLGIVDNGEIIAVEDEALSAGSWKNNIYEITQVKIKAV